MITVIPDGIFSPSTCEFGEIFDQSERLRLGC
jgi:hypothetical protein